MPGPAVDENLLPAPAAPVAKRPSERASQPLTAKKPSERSAPGVPAPKPAAPPAPVTPAEKELLSEKHLEGKADTSVPEPEEAADSVKADAKADEKAEAKADAKPKAPKVPLTPEQKWKRISIALGVVFVALLGVTGFLFMNRNGNTNVADAGGNGGNGTSSGPGGRSSGGGAGGSGGKAYPEPYAKFLAKDEKRLGTWKDQLGKDGYMIFNPGAGPQLARHLPSYIGDITYEGGQPHTWGDTQEPRGLEDPGKGPRHAPCLYSGGQIFIRITARRNIPNKISMYCLDWDSNVRRQTVELWIGEKMVHSVAVENMNKGVWLQYEVCGSFELRVTNDNPASNAVVAGILWDGVDGWAMPANRGASSAAVPASTDALKAGLWGEYFPGLTTYPTVEDAAGMARPEPTLNFGASPGGADNWPLAGACSALYQGFVKIDQPGWYTFATSSDDGSILYVDGKQVVDNDGNHGMAEKTGDVELTPGLHRIYIQYYNAGGGFGLVATFGPRGGGRQPLAGEHIFYAPSEVGK